MEQNLSEDEMVGDFVTESDESVVLFCDMLSRVPATSLAPLASKLLGEEESDDLEYVEWQHSWIGQWSFASYWAKSPINSFGPDLSEFSEPIGSQNSDRSRPKLLIGDWWLISEPIGSLNSGHGYIRTSPQAYTYILYTFMTYCRLLHHVPYHLSI